MSHIRTVRNSKLSIFQSLVEDVVLRGRDESAPYARPTLDNPLVSAATHLSELVHAAAELPHEAPVEVRKLAGGDMAWECAKRAFELVEAKLRGDAEQVDALEDALKDSPCDPGWIEAAVEYAEYFGIGGEKRKIPYVTYEHMDQFVMDRALPRNVTLVLLGDWGTGTDAARSLLEQVATHDPDVLIHLGDIYYSGTARESRLNFLDMANQVLRRTNGEVPVYTLTGNHDMYGGGVGYYGLLPHLNPSPPFAPEHTQRASFFCLRSPGGAFQFVAMDTGLHDHDPFDVTVDITYLEPTEAAWHLDKINRFHDAGGKTILLSHHQLFTAYDMIGKVGDKPAGQEAFNPKLLATFRDVLEADKVSAWFWGHEHNLCIYEPYGPLAKGRCVGHGAIPVFRAKQPYSVDDQIPNYPRLVTNAKTGDPVQLQVNAEGVYLHGYVVVQVDDTNRTAQASYYVEGAPDRPIYQETLT